MNLKIKESLNISFLFFTLVISILTLNNTIAQTKDQELIIKTQFQINFMRSLKNLKPLKTNQNLVEKSFQICQKLQTKKIDTIIKNTIIIPFSDSINLENPNLLNQNFESIGISLSPHQFNCNIMVITLDKHIQWKDLDCPNKKKINIFKLFNIRRI